MSTKTIGTHNGMFHTDETLACAMLTKYTIEFKDAIITRTRDLDLLKQQDIIVDVGGVYDPSTHRYDHHQKSFLDTFSEGHKIRLSSAGLVYKHFGKEIIRNAADSLLKEYEGKLKVDIFLTEEDLDSLYLAVYESFIMGVDGIDNGVNQYPKEVKPAYSNPTSLNARVSRLYPMWTEKHTDENVRFRAAMELTDCEFRNIIRGLILSFYPAKNEVKRAVESRNEVHPSCQLIVLHTPVPWKDHLETFEKQMELGDQIKFVIFPESEEKKAWRIQAVPLNPSSFDFRIGLKAEWRGIQDLVELKATSAIQDIVFVHNSGFIGGARSYDSVIRMGLESIAAFNEKEATKKAEEIPSTL